MEEEEDFQDQVGLRRLGLDDKIVRIRLGKKVEGWKREKIFRIMLDREDQGWKREKTSIGREGRKFSLA